MLETQFPVIPAPQGRAKRVRGGILALFTLAGFVAGASDAAAQDRSIPSPAAVNQTNAVPVQRSAESSFRSLETPAPSLWRAGVGDGFNQGAQEFGCGLGPGLGMKILGSGRSHDWGLAVAQYGWMLSDLIEADHWYRGNWELLAEGFGGGQYRPSADYLVGFAPLLRYNFAPGHRWVPFIDAGAGVTETDIRNGDLSSTFEFNLQLGAGARVFLRDDLALTLQYRFIHVSDANLTSPNLGVNSSTILLGLTWFF